MAEGPDNQIRGLAGWETDLFGNPLPKTQPPENRSVAPAHRPIKPKEEPRHRPFKIYKESKTTATLINLN